jgi:hypothetical protein
MGINLDQGRFKFCEKDPLELSANSLTESSKGEGQETYLGKLTIK